MHLLGQEYSCLLKFAAPFIHVRKEDFLAHSQPCELEDFLDPFRQKENGMKWDMPGKALRLRIGQQILAHVLRVHSVPMLGKALARQHPI